MRCFICKEERSEEELLKISIHTKERMVASIGLCRPGIGISNCLGQVRELIFNVGVFHQAEVSCNWVREGR